MDVAGVHLQRVVEGRVDQLDHHAGILADLRQRQGLDRRDLGRAVGRAGQRVDRVEVFLVAGQVAGQIGGMHQIERRAAQFLVDPGQPRRIEGIAEHADHLVAAAHHGELALERLSQGDPLERRRTGEQLVAGQHRIAQGRPQAADESRGFQPGHLLQLVEHPPPAGGGALAGGMQLGSIAAQWLCIPGEARRQSNGWNYSLHGQAP
ncbi:hypothetical protein D3C78_555100 [compost metagenome]